MSGQIKAGAAAAASLATRAVFDLKATDDTMSGTIAAFMIAMSALEVMAALGGSKAASEAAYRLADAIATGGGA